MADSSLLDTRKQLVFYGSYHTHPVNVLVHMLCMPLIVWSVGTLEACIPLPAALEGIEYRVNDYMLFKPNFAFLYVLITTLYYMALEPVAAILYLPEYISVTLCATSYANTAAHPVLAGVGAHVVGLIAQFLAHGMAEKRAPALFGNFISAFVMAPFFVHLEKLFKMGYRPMFRGDIQREVDTEVAKLKKSD